jgi:SSS family solute:Na+ symporter
MAGIDKLIVLVYLVGIMAVGIAAGYRKKTSSEQFFLAGRSLKWPMIGAALFTANISTIHLVGLSADGFRIGIVVGNFEWMAAFCLIALGLIFVPFYIKSGIRTLPEFLEKRYSPLCRMIMAFAAIFAALMIHIGTSIYAGAKVCESFFNIPIGWTVVIIATVTAIYTILGGLKAVVVTDTIQAVLLLGGCIVLTLIGLSKLPGVGIHSFAELKAAAMPDQLSMAQSLKDTNGNFREYSWLTVMFGYHVLGIWYWCTDQTIVQKTLGAKDMRHGQLGAVFAGCLKILPLFFMVFPGVIAYVLFKTQIIDPNDSLTVMMSNLLPIGLKGLFAAGLLAAVMSTVEAALNSTATVTAEDIVARIRPQTKDRTLVLIGRITAAVVIVLAILWSPLCAKFGSIFVVINKVPMMFAPAITTVFVLGVFWRRGTKQAGVATLIVGLLFGVAYFVRDMPHNVPAEEVRPAIEAGRPSVSEKWVGAHAADMQAAIEEGTVDDWDAIPREVKQEALKADKVVPGGKPEESWMAAPLPRVRAAIEAGRLPADKLVEAWVKVPAAKVEAAMVAGRLPPEWMVINYGHIKDGWGIPFMLAGLILLSVCVVVYVITSLLTPAPTDEDLAAIGWEQPLKVIFGKKITSWTDPRMFAIALGILMTILYCFLH